MENTEDVLARYSPPLLWRFASFVLLCSEASYYLSRLVCHILCFKRYYDQKEEQAHWESSPTSLSFSRSLILQYQNNLWQPFTQRSTPSLTSWLLFISHICVCEKLLLSSDHLSCYHWLFNLLRKFSWNLQPVLRFKTFIFPEQSSSYQSSVSFSLLGSYEEDPWTVEMR